jgi:beta-glucosidase
MYPLFIAFCSLLLNVACASSWPRVQSAIPKDPVQEERIKRLLHSMTLEEKVAQMIQAEIKSVSPDDLTQYPLGAVLNGGGSFPQNNKRASIQDWVNLADQYYFASLNAGKKIPVIWGTDAVHGHNNVFGATIFPHNIGLGAAHNPELIQKVATATALEVMATGLDWIFAPTVAVVRDDRWGRAYEGYAEDPERVKSYASRMIQGIQGDRLKGEALIATAKHFIGDGGTKDGVDQGDHISNESELIRLHAPGYFAAIESGAQTVMASFNSWNGEKIHGHYYLLTEVLKNQIGFDGFVIGDWNGHGQVKGCRNDSCPQAINAGVDMIMVPEDWKAFYHNTIEQVRRGEIPETRVDDAVARILRVKMRYGLFERGAPSTRKFAGNEKVVGSQAHRDLAKQAVRESLVLLKNKQAILPLDPSKNYLVLGSGANNIPKQAGGWSLTWQGTGNTNADFPGASSILDGIQSKVHSSHGKILTSISNKEIEAAIVVFGEEPYAEGQGDLKNLYYGERFKEDLQLLKDLKLKGIKTISIFITGRPLWVNPELNASDAFVAAWLPGSEGSAIADLLFRAKPGERSYDFTGRLSFSWPLSADQTSVNRHDQNNNRKPLFPYGYGLSLHQVDTLGDNLSEDPFPHGNPEPPKRVLDVFKGRPMTPFGVYVQSLDYSRIELLNGLGQNEVLKSMAVDHQVQEDARLVSFNGKEGAQFIFDASSPLNLRALGLKEMDLCFNVYLRDRSADSIYLLVGDLKMDISERLKNLPDRQWTKITIKKSELEVRGLDFSNLKLAFGLQTDGTWELGFSQIRFE